MPPRSWPAARPIPGPAGRSAASTPGRTATLGLAVPNLFVLPFGTALGIYAFWVLLHNETRTFFELMTRALWLARFSRMTDNTERTALGLRRQRRAALAYVLGWISGIVLLLTEHQNRFVRFHAMQSILVFGALSLAWFLCLSIPLLGWLISFILIPPVSAVIWLLLMFKAYQGERFKLPIVGDIADTVSGVLTSARPELPS